MMLLPIYFIQTDFREGAFSMDEKQVEVRKWMVLLSETAERWENHLLLQEKE